MQRVEIIRALLINPQLLILDEPTSVLTPQAVEKLFVVLKKLASEGCSILYISHKLHEIRELCTACTVLRGGRVTGVCNPAEESNASLSRLMIGAEPPELMVEGLPIEGGEGFASWVDVTHGRALMRVTGVDTDSMLSKLCAVNLAEGTTPNSTAFRTSIAGVTTDVIRDDQDGLRSYLLHCERSSGQYLFEALLDAGTEFGCEPGRRVATSSPVADSN
jgi:energy-coupling factor transporter ATP-binding protein EcfA2